MKTFPLLNASELATLTDALPYQKTEEMKQCCELLQLPFSGTKGDMMARILHFIKTGEVLKKDAIPSSVKAPRGYKLVLAPDAPMLHGGYKCDARHRAFFKELIGPHFHFTCTGQDWLKAHWRQGSTPTYQAFADFWQRDYKERKTRRSTPKKEWAYLHFIKDYVPANPGCTHQEVSKAWAQVRLEKALTAKELVRKAAS